MTALTTRMAAVPTRMAALPTGLVALPYTLVESPDPARARLQVIAAQDMAERWQNIRTVPEALEECAWAVHEGRPSPVSGGVWSDGAYSSDNPAHARMFQFAHAAEPFREALADMNRRGLLTACSIRAAFVNRDGACPVHEYGRQGYRLELPDGMLRREMVTGWTTPDVGQRLADELAGRGMWAVFDGRLHGPHPVQSGPEWWDQASREAVPGAGPAWWTDRTSRESAWWCEIPNAMPREMLAQALADEDDLRRTLRGRGDRPFAEALAGWQAEQARRRAAGEGGPWCGLYCGARHGILGRAAGEAPRPACELAPEIARHVAELRWFAALDPVSMRGGLAEGIAELLAKGGRASGH
jgi:hypothetical protein